MNSCQKLMRSMLLLSVVDEEMLELARKSLSQQVVEPEFKLRVSASRVWALSQEVWPPCQRCCGVLPRSGTSRAETLISPGEGNVMPHKLLRQWDECRSMKSLPLAWIQGNGRAIWDSELSKHRLRLLLWLHCSSLSPPAHSCFFPSHTSLPAKSMAGTFHAPRSPPQSPPPQGTWSATLS